jgi:hypothetical protein
MLFFTAPVGIILSVVAGARGAAKWLVALLLIASLILLHVGVIESLSV